LRVDLRGSRVGGTRSSGGGRAAKQKSTTEAGTGRGCWIRCAERRAAMQARRFCSADVRGARAKGGALRRMSVGVDGVVARGGADRGRRGSLPLPRFQRLFFNIAFFSAFPKVALGCTSFDSYFQFKGVVIFKSRALSCSVGRT
jgi:hypothetical protein